MVSLLYSPGRETSIVFCERKKPSARSGGGLKLTDVKTVSTRLQASAMSPGKIALIIGGVLILLGGADVFMALSRKRKGGRS